MSFSPTSTCLIQPIIAVVGLSICAHDFHVFIKLYIWGGKRVIVFFLSFSALCLCFLEEGMVDYKGVEYPGKQGAGFDTLFSTTL